MRRRSGTALRARRSTRTGRSSSGKSSISGHRFGMGAVDLPSNGETIGAAGLQHLDGGSEIEVGYRFLSALGRRATQRSPRGRRSRTASTKWALDRIVAVALPENMASRRVLDKCGLTEIGLVHAYGLEHVKCARSPARIGAVAGSSNRRTPGSGPGSLGSNPSPAVFRNPRLHAGFFIQFDARSSRPLLLLRTRRPDAADERDLGLGHAGRDARRLGTYGVDQASTTVQQLRPGRYSPHVQGGSARRGVGAATAHAGGGAPGQPAILGSLSRTRPHCSTSWPPNARLGAEGSGAATATPSATRGPQGSRSTVAAGRSRDPARGSQGRHTPRVRSRCPPGDDLRAARARHSEERGFVWATRRALNLAPASGHRRVARVLAATRPRSVPRRRRGVPDYVGDPAARGAHAGGRVASARGRRPGPGAPSPAG